MLKILQVGIVGDDMLDVQLNNGNILMLNLISLLDDPLYAPLREDDRILYPKTDGYRVYWRDGPSLTIDSILDLLRAQQTPTNEK